ncbi:MAG TPA: kelch repeat-containing protein [Solirubrobacteraceae bacterium]|nr:kelch repeat-containing protein [Solirubrobacteraceae bacterium]
MSAQTMPVTIPPEHSRSTLGWLQATPGKVGSPTCSSAGDDALPARPIFGRVGLLAAALCLLVAIAGPAPTLALPTAPEWSNPSTPESPPGALYSSIAYDAAAQKLVLFGGFGPSVGNETWVLAGGTWTKQSTPESPPTLSEAAMAYDPATERIVLFGGVHSGSRRNETWTYDGSTWTRQSTPESPPALNEPSIAYDPATRELVLFGGDNGYSASNETWTYDGSTWTKRSPAESPSPRNGASMAYDPATKAIVLFGGVVTGHATTETWTYAASTGTWTEQTPAESPPPRTLPAMAYDAAAGRLVLITGPEGGIGSETWTYDGVTWAKQSTATGPSVRYGAAMAEDPSTGDLVLFGGYLEPEEFSESFESFEKSFSKETWLYSVPGSPPPPVGLCPSGCGPEGAAGGGVPVGSASPTGDSDPAGPSSEEPHRGPRLTIFTRTPEPVINTHRIPVRVGCGEAGCTLAATARVILHGLPDPVIFHTRMALQANRPADLEIAVPRRARSLIRGYLRLHRHLRMKLAVTVTMTSPGAATQTASRLLGVWTLPGLR